ncbi:MAG TPA: glycosyltransferase family 2 protein [Phaeodactylibacter sp.]|nr:glycosyltransferase family 2 protein [Phaeodactylibacter sp.]
MAKPVKISGLIITLNEERNIGDCIRSMQAVVDEVVVVDSFSTDRTPEICKELGVRFIQHPFEGFIEQKNYAVQQASYEHVLSLDADERLSPEMAESIKQVKQNWEGAGYAFNRLNNYCGKWLPHAWYPDRKTRLWDRRRGQWGGINPHDKVLLSGQEAKRLPGDLLHYPYYSIMEHVQQIQKFAEMDAQAKLAAGKRVSVYRDLVLGPHFKFFKLYILKRGFLDGYYGFIFCCLAAGLNFLKYARLWELRRRNED